MENLLIPVIIPPSKYSCGSMVPDLSVSPPSEHGGLSRETGMAFTVFDTEVYKPLTGVIFSFNEHLRRKVCLNW